MRLCRCILRRGEELGTEEGGGEADGCAWIGGGVSVGGGSGGEGGDGWNVGEDGRAIGRGDNEEGGGITSLAVCPRMRAPDAVVCREEAGGFVEDWGGERGRV